MYNGNLLKVKDDIAFLRPTIMVGVPRLYNRIVDGIKTKFGETTGVARCMIGYGLSSKLDAVRKDGTYTHGLYDKLIFSKVKEALGGRVRMMASGGAPLSA